MKKFRLLAVFLTALIPTAAHALAPIIWSAIVVGSAFLSLLAGLQLDYARKDVKTTGGSPVAVYFKLNDSARDATADDVPAPSGAAAPVVPSTVVSKSSGGATTLTIAAHTVNGITYPGTTITANAGGIVQALKSLDPAKVHPSYMPAYLTGRENATVSLQQLYANPSSYSTGFTGSPTAYANYNSASTSMHYLQLQFQTASSSYIYKFKLDNAAFEDCPAGYTRSTGTDQSICNLTDVNAAKATSSTFTDGKCIIHRNNPIPTTTDPDCATLMSQGAFKEEIATDGRTVQIIKDPSNATTETVAYKRNDDGSTDISVAQRGADGSGFLQTATATSTGQVGAVSTTNYQANPVPQYPGQASTSTSTGSGSSTTIGTGSSCGGPNQPACKVEITDGSGSGSADLPAIPAGDGTSTAEDGFASSVMQRFTSFQSFSLPIQQVSCLQALQPFDASIDFFSTPIDMQFSAGCPVISPWEEFLKLAARFGWSAFAAFLIFSRITGGNK